MYHIFKVTNTLFNKFFIGYFDNNKKSLENIQLTTNLANDVKSLGKRFFKREILSSFPNITYTKNKYKSIINKEFFLQNVYNKNIYNKGLAIEFNGLYWHSDEFKDKNYHYDKLKMCQNKGIKLLNIWEDDWNFRQEIVKSIINKKLELISNKINAKECIIKEIDNKTSNLFLNNNHLQGTCSSSIKLGLYYKDELVSLMAFKRKISNKTQFELLRCCSKLNTNVIGGASKLFSYFINNYTYDKIISYVNCDISDGSLYKILGFKEIGHTGINYWWSDNINKFNETEDQIMKGNNFKKIYGTGNIRFEYINKLNN